MTVAPPARVPAAPRPLRDPPVPVPRRPTVRAPGHEPAPLPTGRGNPHDPDRHAPASGPGPFHGSPATPGTPPVAGGRARPPHRAGDPAADRAVAGTAGRAGGADPGAGPPPARPPHARATALVRSMVEVLAGRRQPAQLAAAVTPEVLRYLSASRPAAVRAAGAGRVHVRQPHPGAAEVVAVCRIGDRTRALALRLDLGPGAGDRERRWTCTAVRLL